MKSVFIESSIFEKFRAEYLSDEGFQLLQCELLAEPDKGDVIQDTGGLRKVRVAAKGKGKHGGARVIYYYFDQYHRFYLLTIYAKNEMSDLSSAQKKQLKDFLEVWKHEQT
ncbi:type II toxin-antitoxin system RelE/ParE family toxin [Paraglaciecola sp. 25GB23A]|uniref:type II toxin-antitoxin system RelE/ParE family toxin n=1 Tax=Paraglaciecola sp. 25GB23A TaxID=3156068 RepID=UPI0032AE9E43